jgi:UDP-N-acetylglucosamine--N-acetylmuramyl-(pentapeptide) pyrophosphoryl-undecaprenol N-acetylglucosamine transferase
MSFTVMLSCKNIKSKNFLIEPNMVLGRANKFFLYFSEKLLSYSKNLINFPKGLEPKQIIIRPLIRKKIL